MRILGSVRLNKGQHGPARKSNPFRSVGIEPSGVRAPKGTRNNSLRCTENNFLKIC